MVETKKVSDRRQLSFGTMDDILADIDALDAGPRRTTGNWTDAQIVWHVTAFVTGSIDGFDVRAPWYIRMTARLARKRILRNPINPGFKLPPILHGFVPDPDVRWEDALADLRRDVQRVRDGARMTADSPAFGAMSHEEWEMLHCRHAEMHFSFIHPG